MTTDITTRLVQDAESHDWWGHREAAMTHRKITRAALLGTRDAAQGVHRDMDDDGSAWLMDQLAETGETTEDNHARRTAMCDAYAKANTTPLARDPEDQHDGHISCTPEGCVLR